MPNRRRAIRIDAEKRTGCGECIPNCPEGALQIIDGKARLVSDLFCDGLGACIGHCSEGAITIEEREAQACDEKKVHMEVPCCFGLVRLVKSAIAASGKVIPFAEVAVSVKGEVLPSA